MKRACDSNTRITDNHSNKPCVCGGHSKGARKKYKKWSRETMRDWVAEQLDDPEVRREFDLLEES